MLQRIRRSGGAEAQEAIDWFIRSYWKPIYHYFRNRGEGIEDAKDLTQEFLSHVVEKDTLARFDPQGGRFRPFLLLLLKRFLLDQRDRRRALKRGGGAGLLVADFEDAESEFLTLAPRREDPEALFRRAWALGVVHGALALLARELEAEGRNQWIRILSRQYDLDPDAPKTSYAALAREYGLSESDITNGLHRLRLRLRELVAQEIRASVGSEQELQEELEDLFNALGGSPPVATGPTP
jgi:RNA polymerase sigma-70 factor (ECF subfamily)